MNTSNHEGAAHDSRTATPNAVMQFPAGARLRVRDICRDNRTGRPGLVPWVSRTWLKKVAAGEIPQGELLGGRTRVWRIEVVQAAIERLTSGASAREAS